MPVGSDCPALPRTAGRLPRETPRELGLGACSVVGQPLAAILRPGQRRDSSLDIQNPLCIVPDLWEEPQRTRENHLFLGTPSRAPLASLLIHRWPRRRSWAPRALAEEERGSGGRAAGRHQGSEVSDPALQDSTSVSTRSQGLGKACFVSWRGWWVWPRPGGPLWVRPLVLGTRCRNPSI